MNSHENDFYQLRKLLAVKRHEQPPPRYFDRLQANISAAIHEPIEENWFMSFLRNLSVKPAMGCAFGLAVFTSLGYGLVHSFNTPATIAENDGPLFAGAENKQRKSANLKAPEAPEIFGDFVQPVALSGSSLAPVGYTVVSQ